MSLERVSESLVFSDIPQGLRIFSIPERRQNDLVNMRGLIVYAPRESKATTMLIGDANSQVALCTLWADPWQVVNENQIESFSIVAPLRTPFGINILLWNLARNPRIRHLCIWAGDKLDKSSIGSKSRQYLESLWRYGLGDDGKISGTNYTLVKELGENGGLAIVRKIISNVEVHDFTGIEKGRLGQAAKELSVQEPYMQPYSFPEFKITPPETFPSEGAGFEVREKNLFLAWPRALGVIILYGKNVPLETGGALVREIKFLRVVIEPEDLGKFYFPSWVSEIGELDLSPASFENYYRTKILPHQNLVEIYPGVMKFERGTTTYFYSELMFFFPRSNAIDKAVRWILGKEGIISVYEFLSSRFPVSEERKRLAEQIMRDDKVAVDEERALILLEIFAPPVNQVARAIKRIKSIPDDADKTIVLWDPATHGEWGRGRPCLVYVSFLVRGGRIDMQTTWRSHDMAKGWPENIYGMTRLQDYIAQQTGYVRGVHIVHSESAHVYRNNLPLAEEIWHREVVEAKTRKSFIAEEDSDPRGNAAISVLGKDIVVIIKDPVSGDPLKKIQGTYKDIFYAMKKLELLSRPDHWMDFGSELAKAEICRRLGIPYIQDKPFNIKLFGGGKAVG